MSFLRHEVEGEEHRSLTETTFGSAIKRKDSHQQVQKDEPTAATLFANTSAGKICCVFCDRSHPKRKYYLKDSGGEISAAAAAEHDRFTVTVESLDGKYSTSVSLLDQPKICSTLPRIRDENLLAELASRGIKLTDVGRDTPPIRILLGADVLRSILTGRIEIFTSGVSAVETLFGWTISGLG
ncbi:transposable element Tc1 transposase [Trichonephila clavipes]|nr:transposable element Tc1 transposase [Trichonephila clavipes]